MLIGKNRKEAIDWIQDQIGYVTRPIAEMTYHGLVKRGIVTEEKDMISADHYLDPESIRDIGRDTYASMNSNRVEMVRRNSRSAYRQNHALRQKMMRWKAPETTTDVIKRPDQD